MKIRFDAPPASERQVHGVEVPYAAARRRLPRWRWSLLVLAVLALPAWLLVRFALDRWAVTAPGVVDLEPLLVRATGTGVVQRILPEGASTRAGEVIVRLQPYASAEQSQRVAAPDPGAAARAARRAGASEALALAERRFAQASDRADAVQELLRAGAATRGELDAAQAVAASTRADLIRARTELRTLDAVPATAPSASSSPMPAAIEQRAPDGMPSAVVFRVLVRPGESVVEGAELMELRAGTPPTVRAWVDPAQSRYARAGREAQLRFPDGGCVRAVVVGTAGKADRPPATRDRPRAERTGSLVVRLRPLAPLAFEYQVHDLPLDVRFEHVR